MQVAAVRTPQSPAQAMGTLLAAGCPLSALRMVAAQSAVETAGWQAMYGWNYGNVTTTGPDYQILPGNPLHFAVYGSPLEGARAYLAWLSQHGALPYATLGDLDGYVSRLRIGCYLGCIGSGATEQDYDSYEAAIGSWMHRLGGVVPEAPGSPWLAWAAIIAGAGLLAGGLGVIEIPRSIRRLVVA